MLLLIRIALVAGVLALLTLGGAEAQTTPPCPVKIDTGGCGANVPVGTPMQVLYGSYAPRSYERIVNAGTPSQGVAWCNRHGSPGVNSAGSFAIAPPGNTLGLPWKEEFWNGPGSPPPPQDPLLCVSDGGTSGSSQAVLSVEIR